jgi:hypothetical protein
MDMSRGDIAFKLKVGNSEIDFNGGSLSDEHISALLNDLIIPSMAPPAPAPIMPMNLLTKEQTEDLKERIELADEERKKAEELNDKAIKAREEKQTLAGTFGSRKRKVDIRDNQTSSNFSVADLMREKLGSPHQESQDEEKPDMSESELTESLSKHDEAQAEKKTEDFMHTGIKWAGEKGDKPRYRLHYDCPKCTESGRHYIPDFVKSVSCHKCQARMLVEPATDKGFGADDDHRDEWGNFFVAKSLFITR